MTERRRPPDNDDGQESLFGGEAFALSPGTQAPWQRHAPAREDVRPRVAEAGATAPLDEAQAGMFEADVSAPPDDAHAGVFDAHVSAPLDEAQEGVFEAQAEVEYGDGPTAEDLAAYALDADLAVTPVPTEVPAHDGGAELDALERATVSPGDVRKPRAPLAGPTLDDVMSRVWEGLATGLPAACPVCHGEVVASFAGALHGSCSSCGTTIQ